MRFGGPKAATDKTFFWLLVWIAGVTLYLAWRLK